MHRRTFGPTALVLSVVFAACGDPPQEAGPGGETGDALPATLQGEWQYGTISSLEYHDPSSGKYVDASGASVILKVGASGTFTRSGVTVITTSGRTSKIQLNESGVVDLDGNVLTLIPTTSYARGYQCTPGRSFENRTPSNSVNTWKITGSGRQAVLALGRPNDPSIDDLYNRPRGTTGSISGRLTLREGAGAALGDVVVMACAVDGGCRDEAKWRFTPFTGSGRSATFEIENVPFGQIRVTRRVTSEDSSGEGAAAQFAVGVVPRQERLAVGERNARGQCVQASRRVSQDVRAAGLAQGEEHVVMHEAGAFGIVEGRVPIQTFGGPRAGLERLVRSAELQEGVRERGERGGLQFRLAGIARDVQRA